MLPAPRIALLTLGVLLISSSAAEAASKTVSVPVPADGQVAVALAGGAKSVKVKSAPAGLTVAGGVKKGRLAVAVVRPRGVAATGKVVFTVGGRPKGVKTFPTALDGGRAGAGCSNLGALLSKRLKGSADVRALSGVLAAKLCGKAAPANAAAVLGGLGLGAPPVPPALPAPPATPPASSLTRPASITNPSPTATATPTPGGGGPAKACSDGADNDGDGQTDTEDPGCSDGGDTTENSEVPVSAECAGNSGVGMGDDPTFLGAGINGCGPFTTIRIDVAPGVRSCDVLTGGAPWECGTSGPYARAVSKDGKAIDTADVNLHLTGAVKCDRPATIALYRPNGEVAELRGPVGHCHGGQVPPPPPAEKPACANGKDDDGDGMIDDYFAEGATDPDPGCTSTTDTTESSEIAAPASCKIVLGLWQDPRIAGATAQGCGSVQGFWYHAPGTVTDCAYRLGTAPAEACQVVRETGGTMFAMSTESLAVAVGLTADADCRPMTLALIKDDNSVWFFRDRLDGC